MEKIKIANNAFIYPMPMVIVGSCTGGKLNYMAVGWVTRVNFNPPMIAVALGPHHTNGGIHENKEFSVNVPGCDMIAETDYVGVVSGAKIDKSTVFESFYGELKFAPMIKKCPLTMECRLIDCVKLPTNELFIGEIIGAYCEDGYMTDGKPDIRKIDPFTLTMPDNRYWKVGESAGRAWSIGMEMKKEKEKKS